LHIRGIAQGLQSDIIRIVKDHISVK